jgi:hypothetical protein
MNKQPITSWEDALRAGEQSRQNAGTGTELSMMLGIGVLALYPVFFGIDYIAVRFPVVGVFVYGLLMIPSFFIIQPGVRVLPEREGDVDDASSTLILTTLCCVLATVSYSQFCRHLNYFVPGFSVVRSSFWSWLAFGIDECLNAILFDAPNIYSWHVSEIKPIALWAKSLQFVYHFLLLLVMAVAIMQEVQRTRNTWRRPRLSEESLSSRVWILFLTYTGLALLISAIAIPVLMSYHERLPDMSLVRIGISLGIVVLGMSAIAGGVLVWIRSRSLTLLFGMRPGNNTSYWKEWYLWRYLIWHVALLVGAVWVGQTLVAYGMGLVPLTAV